MKIFSLSLIHVAILSATMAFSLASAAQDQNKQVAKDTSRLSTVKVNADAEIADGPVDGYHAKRSATGTKTDTAILDIPVSVQIVSREVMDDQLVQTIADAVKNVSGVYIKQGPDGNTMDSFSIRGFELDHYGATYLDGTKDFSRAPKETAGLERIEILKGPAAIMYGRIEPGGMINRVSKRPQAESFTKLNQQIGSNNYFRTTLDSTGALTNDGDWLYRVNIAGEDTDGFVDDTHNRRTYIAPQIEWLASDQTIIRTGVEYQKNDRSWALTYGTIGDANGPVKIPRSTNLHDKDDKYKDDSLSWKVEWEHNFNDDWKLKQRISYVDRNSVAKGSGLSEVLDTEGNYSRSYWGWNDEQATTAATNLDLTGKFSTGAITHTLLIGGDYFDEDYDSGGWEFNGTEVISTIYHPNNTDAPYDNDHVILPFGYKNLNNGFYVQDQMTALDERLHIMIGARHDNAKGTYFFSDTVEIADDKSTTWRGGILYKLSPSASIYTSYVEGFGAPNYSWGSDEVFDPQTSNQYEIGTKIEISPAFGITIAAFELVKDNLTMADPADETKTILAGEATSKGLEIDINGQVTNNWDLIASYAYTDVRYTRSDSMQGERLFGVPRHGASFWNTYKFDSTGWKIGGGVVYRSERLGTQRAWSPDIYPYTLGAYTLLDLMVSYDFTVKNLPVKAQLNIANTTDKIYHPSSYGGMDRISLGSPRSIMGSVNISF